VAEEFASKGDAAKQPLVAAVMGGYGVAAEPGADYDFDYEKVDTRTLIRFHHDRMAGLLAGKPDILLFETISSLKEVRAIAQMLSEWKSSVGNASLPQVWLACSCRLSDDEKSVTACGDPWEETVRCVDEAEDISAFGINCTWPSICKDLLLEASRFTSKPLIAYPNNGVWHKGEQTWVPAAPEQFAQACCEIYNACHDGLDLVAGGCCCTGPADIQALAHAIRDGKEDGTAK